MLGNDKGNMKDVNFEKKHSIKQTTKNLNLIFEIPKQKNKRVTQQTHNPMALHFGMLLCSMRNNLTYC